MFGNKQSENIWKKLMILIEKKYGQGGNKYVWIQ